MEPHPTKNSVGKQVGTWGTSSFRVCPGVGFFQEAEARSWFLRASKMFEEAEMLAPGADGRGGLLVRRPLKNGKGGFLDCYWVGSLDFNFLKSSWVFQEGGISPIRSILGPS